MHSGMTPQEQLQHDMAEFHKLMEGKPYGFKSWFRDLWKVCHDQGVVRKDTTYWKSTLDPDGWMPYFMMGLHPINAVKQDLYEQA